MSFTEKPTGLRYLNSNPKGPKKAQLQFRVVEDEEQEINTLVFVADEYEAELMMHRYPAIGYGYGRKEYTGGPKRHWVMFEGKQLRSWRENLKLEFYIHLKKTAALEKLGYVQWGLLQTGRK